MGDPSRQIPPAAPLRIATRGSRLALWQASWVREALLALGQSAALVVVETQGDRDQAPFQELRGQGFFTKAVQDALLDGRADVAVHSLKDLPSAATPGLVIAAIPAREDTRDVLLAQPPALEPERPLGLRAGSRLGTSAVRRRAQALALDASLRVQELRGNVPTRVEKLRQGQYDAILLAAAGLNRLALDLSGLSVQPLEVRRFVPAPGQGALALECRGADESTAALLAGLDDPRARLEVEAERGLMARLQGGCQLALGASARAGAHGLELTAWYEGRLYQTVADDPEAAIERLYTQLRAAHPAAVLP